jgi:hypothetical protein
LVDIRQHAELYVAIFELNLALFQNAELRCVFNFSFVGHTGTTTLFACIQDLCERYASIKRALSSACASGAQSEAADFEFVDLANVKRPRKLKSSSSSSVESDSEVEVPLISFPFLTFLAIH